jgi:hypothetical protein
MYARAAYLMLPVSSCRAESAVELSYISIQVDQSERRFKVHIVTHFCDELAQQPSIFYKLQQNLLKCRN